MSKDKTPALLEAVAGLPVRQRGLVLGVMNTLRETKKFPNAPQVLKDALKVARSPGSTAVEQVVSTIFEDLKKVKVAIDQTASPHEVLKTRVRTDTTEALWIDSGLTKILELATGKMPTSVSMKPRRLKKDAYDREIKGALPTRQEIDPTTFIWMLATELSKVMRGESSYVLAKDRWCLFYVAGFVVRVHWHPDISEWFVLVWGLDARQWDAEGVVFSCN